MTSRCQQDRERGSVALGILLAVMVTALIPVILTMTLAEQRVTRHDRESGIALEAADAGLQDARFRLINRMVLPSDTLPVTVSGSVNGVPYTWSGRPDPAASAAAQNAGLSWLVVSRGGHAGKVQRTVRAYLTQPSLYTHGLFLNNSATLNGGNLVTSYNPTTASWNTGRGVVGTNGSLDIQGNVTVDGVQIYDWSANPGAGRCVASGNSGPLCTVQPDTGPTSSAKRTNIGPRFPLPQQVSAIEQQLSTVTPTCPSSGSWSASSVAAAGATATFPWTTPGTYCFDNLTFDRNTVFPGTGTYTLLVRGATTVGNGLLVNCSACATTPPTTLPTASRLLIMTPTTGAALNLGNNAALAAGFYAPRGSCSGGAQGTVYGSMLCDTGGNVGGWSFHYDQTLGSVAGNGDFAVTRWDESPGASLP